MAIRLAMASCMYLHLNPVTVAEVGQYNYGQSRHKFVAPILYCTAVNKERRITDSFV
jgi:hypothetical protein